MTIYFTSDLHLGHRAIIDMTGRPFEAVEHMNEALINNINDTVRSPRDELYVLGDISYRLGREDALSMIEQIRCKKLHLICGNHDKNWSGFSVFSSVSDYAEIKVDNSKVVLFHYPIMDWHGMHYGAYHLHGHIHSRGEYNLKNAEAGIRRYDVGVDANGYAPVSFDEIVSFFDGSSE